MSTYANSTPSKAELARRALGRLLAAIVVLAAILFLTAGTFRYWEAWLYLAVLFVPIIGFFFYMTQNAPDLLERRMKLKEKERTQGAILNMAGVALVLALVLPGFDKRYGWSSVPLWLVVTADIVILLGYGLFTLVMKENHYASRIIEVERGQMVISTGPYAVVRHPMYVAMLLIYIATPIALGSYWAVLPVLVLPFVLAARIRTEEAVLMRELIGYEAYVQKVRYRMIPGVW